MTHPFAHKFERIYTIENWYDGPLDGVADFQGTPHAFTRVFSEEVDRYTEVYAVRPLDAETFALVMQSWAIWLRCEAAYKKGQYTLEQLLPTWPALPDEVAEHRRLERLIGDRRTVDAATSLKAKGELGRCTDDPEEDGMRWTPIE